MKSARLNPWVRTRITGQRSVSIPHRCFSRAFGIGSLVSGRRGSSSACWPVKLCLCVSLVPTLRPRNLLVVGGHCPLFRPSSCECDWDFSPLAVLMVFSVGTSPCSSSIRHIPSTSVSMYRRTRSPLVDSRETDGFVGWCKLNIRDGWKCGWNLSLAGYLL